MSPLKAFKIIIESTYGNLYELILESDPQVSACVVGE
jgi:hypothetical protein